MMQTRFKVQDGYRSIYFHGKNSRPQLLCIHGGMGLSSDSLFEGLAGLSDVFDLVFMDQRGCGKSDAAGSGSYALEDFARDIRDVVSQLDKGRPIGIFGHSLGGMIALKALAQYPDLFKFAILSNTAHDDSWRAASQSAMQRLDRERLEEVGERYKREPDDSSLRDLAILYGSLYFPELDAVEAEKRMSQFSYRNDALPYMGAKVYPGMDLIEEASSINVPVLVVGGSVDVVVPPRHQESLCSCLQRANIAHITGAGHFPFITGRDEFKRAVVNWWETSKGEMQ